MATSVGNLSTSSGLEFIQFVIRHFLEHPYLKYLRDLVKNWMQLKTGMFK